MVKGKSASADLFARFRRAWDHLVPEPVQGVTAAFSGGSDSTALLALLADLGRERGFRVAAAHLDHGLRLESADDLLFAKKTAESLGLEFVGDTADVGASARRTGRSIEEEARRIRYAFLARIREKTGYPLTATGHTADDMAEGVLMNLIRGTGPSGLAGIPSRRGPLVRPLLEFSRAELRAWLDDRGFGWREDSSNQDLQFPRNRVRRHLLPLLEREYNPRLREALVRTARIIEDEEEVWAVLLKQAKGQTGWVEENGRVLLSARSVIQMGPALARRLIRSAAARVVPDVQGLAWDHVEAVLALCREGSGARDLPGGPRVRIRDGWLRIETRGEAPIQGYSLPLLVPGETELSVRSGRIHAVMEPDPRTLDPSQYQGNRVLMDADAIQGPLRVRSVQPGDRYQPLGLTGTRKLADVFREAGLSVEARRLQPIIVDDEGILWPVAGRPAHRVRITSNTRNAISLVFEPGPPRENDPDPKSNHAALNDG